MAWGRKETPVTPPVSATPDEIISEMLSAYQQHFYETAKGKPDPAVNAAKATIARANKIIADSRIGYSMCALLDHVKHWDAWSKRDDFLKYVAFPVTDVTGTRDKSGEGHDRRTIDFRYSSVPYTLIFVDKGVPSYGEYRYGYGTVELVANYHPVLGIDISRDASEDYDFWRFDSAFAFGPGDWMKHLVEMAALIDVYKSNLLTGAMDREAVSRAARIKL